MDFDGARDKVLTGLLSKERMDAWHALIPEGEREAVTKVSVADEKHVAAVEAAIERQMTHNEALDFVRENDGAFVAIGRARRLRFLATCLSRYDLLRQREFLLRLTETDGDDTGSAGGKSTGTAACYFLEDIRAWAVALAQRSAVRLVDKDTLEAVTGAGYEAAGELEMKGTI